MTNTEPELIESELSGPVDRDGVRLEVFIYRLETQSEWTLEVVDPSGTSTVWDDLFESDRAARDEVDRTLDTEGLDGFLVP